MLPKGFHSSALRFCHCAMGSFLKGGAIPPPLLFLIKRIKIFVVFKSPSSSKTMRLPRCLLRSSLACSSCLRICPVCMCRRAKCFIGALCLLVEAALKGRLVRRGPGRRAVNNLVKGLTRLCISRHWRFLAAAFCWTTVSN